MTGWVIDLYTPFVVLFTIISILVSLARLNYRNMFLSFITGLLIISALQLIKIVNNNKYQTEANSYQTEESGEAHTSNPTTVEPPIFKPIELMGTAKTQWDELIKRNVITKHNLIPEHGPCFMEYESFGQPNNEYFSCNNPDQAIARAYEALVSNNLATLYDAVQPETIKAIEEMREQGATVNLRKVGADACAFDIEYTDKDGTPVSANFTQDCRAFDDIIQAYRRDFN